MNQGLMPIREKIKRRKKLAVFLVFLLFSSILWLLIKLSNVYSITTEVKLNFADAPFNVWINEKDLVQTITVNVSAQGFRLIRLRYFSGKTHPVRISLEKVPLRKLNQNVHYILLLNIKDVIKSGLKMDEADISFTDNEIYLNSFSVNEKKIPVKARIQVEYATSFGQYGSVIIKPDSILIQGPDHVIDTISAVYTKPISAKNLSTNIKGNIELQTDKSLVRTEIKSVDFELFTEKFTENKLRLKILQPDGVSLKLFPEFTNAYFRVALKDFEKTSPDDFLILADTTGISENRRSLRLLLISKPDYIDYLRLEPESVEFIILQ